MDVNGKETVLAKKRGADGEPFQKKTRTSNRMEVDNLINAPHQSSHPVEKPIVAGALRSKKTKKTKKKPTKRGANKSVSKSTITDEAPRYKMLPELSKE